MINQIRKYFDSKKYIKDMLGLFFLIASIFIFWGLIEILNENKTFKFAMENAIHVSSDNISTETDGRLVHFIVKAQTNDVIKDNIFSIKTDSIALIRNVKMYQWYPTGKKNITYKKGWKNYSVKNHNQKYKNPDFPFFYSVKRTRKNIQFGKFKMKPWESLLFFDDDIYIKDKYILKQENIPHGYYFYQNIIFTHSNAQNPQIGDLIIEFFHIPAAEMTIVGKQDGEYITPYFTNFGTIAIAAKGRYSIEEMFIHRLEANKVIFNTCLFLGILTAILCFLLLKPTLIYLKQKFERIINGVPREI